jgi:hypothetical protein
MKKSLTIISGIKVVPKLFNNKNNNKTKSINNLINIMKQICIYKNSNNIYMLILK